MAEKEYQRLTRAATRGFVGITRASLWLGSDHLLCVETTGYSEIYKRFYFRDIEAIVVRATTSRNIWTMVWAVVVFLFLIFGFANDTPGKEICFSIAGLAALALVINLVRGPTCTCEIRTLVQTEKLPLSRIRKVRKFLDRVRPLIASAQGQLTPEEVTARFSEPPLAAPTPAAPAPTPVAGASETPNAAPASSLSSLNEDLSRLGSGERNSAEGEGPRGPSEREQASQRAGVRSLRAQGEISPSPSAEDPNAPPRTAS
jgi:hypothetical protein